MGFIIYKSALKFSISDEIKDLGVFGPKIWTPISGWKMKIGGSNKDRLKGLEKFFQTKQEKIIPLSLEKKSGSPPLITYLMHG